MVTMFVPFATGVFGLVLPDMVVKQMRKRFMARLEKGLPDALDMMVICAQAGLGTGTGDHSGGGRNEGCRIAIWRSSFR